LKAYGDGHTKREGVYEVSESKGVETVIKPRKNSRIDAPSEPRGRAVIQYKRLGHENWAKFMG